jgi:hypothetical protein
VRLYTYRITSLRQSVCQVPQAALIISDEMPLPTKIESVAVLIFSLHSTGLLDYHLSIWGHQSFKVVDAVNTLSPGCMRMETIQPEPYRREGGVATRSHNGDNAKALPESRYRSAYL